MTTIFWIIALLIVVFGFVVFRGAPYVPSKQSDLKRAFDELYPLGPNDTLIDIGSGDGVVLRAAARRGAHAIGYELNPILVWISRFFCRKYQAIEVKLADFWYVSFSSKTTVIYTFGDARDIAKMAAKVEREATRLQKPLYFISYAFAVPGRTIEREVGTHKLYKIAPLQPEKP